MASGGLDRRVQFRRVTMSDDGFTAGAETWADHGSPVPASRADVSDGEKARAGGIEASLMTRFKVHSSAFTRDLTPTDRLVTEGVTFNITGIKEPPGTRRQWLEISAIARADQ